MWLIFHDRSQMTVSLFCFGFLGLLPPARNLIFPNAVSLFPWCQCLGGKATQHTVLVTLKGWNRQFSPSFSTLSEFISNICDPSNSSFFVSHVFSSWSFLPLQLSWSVAEIKSKHLFSLIKQRFRSNVLHLVPYSFLQIYPVLIS